MNFKKLRLLWRNVYEIRNWQSKTICGTCWQSIQKCHFLVSSCERFLNKAWRYQSFPKNQRQSSNSDDWMFTWREERSLRCSFSKWLPMKSFFSHSFMQKELLVIKKLLLMITIVVHVLEIMNQLKNGFSAQDVRFGFIATVSLMIIDDEIKH